MDKVRIPLALFVAINVVGSALADIHYVADARVEPEVNPAYPYTSPETASFCVMEAIDAADPGDTVMILPGTYGSEGVLYRLKEGVDLMGSGSDRATILAEVSAGPDSMVSGLRFESTQVNARTGAYINECLFESARVEVDAPSSAPATIRRCRFIGPSPTPSGLSRVSAGRASALVLDCTFELEGGGSGVGVGEGQQFEIIGCEFRGCERGVSWSGAGPGGRISNSLFVGNSCAVRVNSVPMAIQNCTFYGNDYAVWVASYCDAGPEIKSSILWESSISHIFLERTDGFGIPIITFSDVQGGYEGLGNISAYPFFNSSTEPHVGFGVAGFSPCIDAGDPFSHYSNEPEPNGGRVNMGWHGNTWQANTSEKVDTDGDNIRDDWEMQHFGNLEGDMWRDADGDDLPDREECWYLTDPNNPDSDEDTLPDGREVIDLGTNPLTPDTDNDGTPDAKEVSQGTDPLDWTDAFTVLDFYIEEGYLYITYPTNRGYEYSLYSSNWPNGPFGFTVSPYRGRYGVLTHTDILRLGPYNRFFCIKARKYLGP